MGGSTIVDQVLSRVKLAKISIFFLHLIPFWSFYLTQPGFFSSGRGTSSVPEKGVLLDDNFDTSACFFSTCVTTCPKVAELKKPCKYPPFATAQYPLKAEQLQMEESFLAEYILR